MDKIILKINFSKLKKLEVRSLAKSVIEIVEKHNPEDLQIKEIFDKLVELEPQIDHLNAGYTSHWLTKEISILRRRRNALAQGLLNRIKAIHNGAVTGMVESAKIAMPIANHYLQGLAKEKENIKVETISLFLDLADKNAELYGAIETMNLISDLDNLKLVTSDISMLYDKRRESTSARPKAKTLERVDKIKTAILNLVKQIEVALIKHTELNYSPLVDELNEEITKAKAGIKIRTSYNQKKAEKANDNNEVVVTSHSEEPSETSQATPNMHVVSVDTDNEEDFDELDIKKTVAVSTKQSRLPNISSEA